MKKISIKLLAASACMLSPLPAMAMDEGFGPSFTRETPAALMDSAPVDDGFNMEDFRPELIEPAAGDYFDSEKQGIAEEFPKNGEAVSKESAAEPTQNEIDL